MAVRSALLRQLLALDERDRVEIAHALLASVEDDDRMSEADRAKLQASIDRSLNQIDAGETVPFADVLASLRAKRAAR